MLSFLEFKHNLDNDLFIYTKTANLQDLINLFHHSQNNEALLFKNGGNALRLTKYLIWIKIFLQYVTSVQEHRSYTSALSKSHNASCESHATRIFKSMIS